MVLVGYNPGSLEPVTTTSTETWCRYRQWYDRYYRTGCRYSDEFYYQSYCCWEETVTETIPASDSYWKVQNQYSDGWGEDGFIRYGVEDGAGACGFNVDVDYVILNNDMNM